MDHSEVMANLRQLSDVIGPRLSGSAAMRRANDWTAERFRAYLKFAPTASDAEKVKTQLDQVEKIAAT